MTHRLDDYLDHLDREFEAYLLGGEEEFEDNFCPICGQPLTFEEQESETGICWERL